LLGGSPVKASTVEVVAAGELAGLLDSADERHVLYALDQLQTVDPDVLREKEGALLQHASEHVKSRVLALRALWGARAAPTTTTVGTPAASPPAAADAGMFEMDAARRRLSVHLDDPDPDLRHAAYQSLPLLGSRESIALLVGRLAWSRDRKEARDALAAFGSRAVGTLGDYLADAGVPLGVRREIPRVLATIGGQDALFSLVRGARERGDAVLMQRTLWAMTRIRKQNEDVVVPLSIVDPQVREEVGTYLRLLVRRSATEGSSVPGVRLLRQALGERVAQSRERIFRRLALTYPPRDMLRAHRGLIAPSPRVRAQSMEFLETVLSPRHKFLLGPLFDDAPEAERAARGATLLGVPRPTLAALISELVGDPSDRWLRACAFYVAGELRLAEVKERLEDGLASSDGIVREAAARTSQRLMPSPA
jgi:HEAT repeat protein